MAQPPHSAAPQQQGTYPTTRPRPQAAAAPGTPTDGSPTAQEQPCPDDSGARPHTARKGRSEAGARAAPTRREGIVKGWGARRPASAPPGNLQGAAARTDARTPRHNADPAAPPARHQVGPARPGPNRTATPHLTTPAAPARQHARTPVWHSRAWPHRAPTLPANRPPISLPAPYPTILE